MLYEIFRWLFIVTAYIPQAIFFKRKAYYEQGAPRRPWKKGGALVISNHYNMGDYLLNKFTVLPRKLNVVASEMPYQHKFLAFGMRFCGGIEANRITKSMRFVDQSAALIRKGQLVQIFPEGRNTPDGLLHPFRQSYILIAHRANAPIIPIVTDGHYHLFKRAHYIVGKPILLSDYIDTSRPVLDREARERLNAVIHDKVQYLRDELERLTREEKCGKRRERRNQNA